MFKAAIVVAALLGASSATADEPPLRDPMRPFGRDATPGMAAADPAAPRFALTAVVVSPTRRVAVVNGKTYFVGDAVDGAEIVAIELDSVRVREGGAERVISLRRPGAGRQSVQGDPVP